MASNTHHIPRWVDAPPTPFDIVACYYPEEDPEPGSSPKLRPALVIGVLKGRSTGTFACDVYYGTKHLKLGSRDRDLTIQNAADLAIIGLPTATRFDLDRKLLLPWTPDFFGCWSGYKTPKLGALTETYVREYAWLMMLRQRTE